MSTSQFWQYRGWSNLLAIACLFAALLASHQVFAKPILFDFEDVPKFDEGDGKNPVFEREGFSVEFFGRDAPHPKRVAQWTNDYRSIPYSGVGSMRLSNLGGTPFISGPAYASFSTPVLNLSLFASIFENRLEIQHELLITAIGEDGLELASVTIESLGSLEDPAWHRVEFENIGPVTALHFSGMSNYVHWDDLTVTPVPEPTTDALFLASAMSLLILRNLRLERYVWPNRTRIDGHLA